MLKTQLFIVAPAKKLWPWQNSAGGFGLDLIWLSEENNNLQKISSRIDVAPLLLIDLLLKVSDIMRLVCEGSWFVQTQNFAHFCGHLVASQNFLAHQYQADKKLTFYRWNDSSSCFERLNQQFLLPWTWISRFRFCRVVSTCTMLRFGTRFGGQLPDRMATLGCWISADSGP